MTKELTPAEAAQVAAFGLDKPQPRLMPTPVENPEVQALNVKELLAAAKTFRELIDPDTTIAPGSMIGLWLATADALQASFPQQVSTVEWGVECSVVGFSKVHRFPDLESCERFIKIIKNPPLWADVPDGDYRIVSRHSATPWQPVTPPQSPSTPTKNGEQS